jgi:hypothetical protein
MTERALLFSLSISSSDTGGSPRLTPGSWESIWKATASS